MCMMEAHSKCDMSGQQCCQSSQSEICHDSGCPMMLSMSIDLNAPDDLQ